MVKTEYFEPPLKAWVSSYYHYEDEHGKFGDELVVFAEVIDEDYPVGTYWYVVYNPRTGNAITLASEYVEFDKDDLDND